MSNRKKFESCYRKHLAEVAKEKPEDYKWLPGDTADSVATRMMAALDKDTYNKDGLAFKRTCKELGIKHTYTAINAFIKS